MKKTGLILLFLPLLLSCDRVHYEFNRDFKDFRWAKNDQKEFAFKIADDGAYDIVLDLSHLYDYPFSDLPLTITITDPNGETETLRTSIKITDTQGNKTGDCAMDICDLNFNIKNGVNLTRGAYKIVISNDFNGPYLSDIIGIGIAIKHA